MVTQQHSRPQLIPCFTLQQAIRVFNLKPHAGEQEHDPFERARSCPLSKSAIPSNVQTGRGNSAIDRADYEGGEGSSTACIEIDVLVFGGICDDIEDLRGQEDGDGSAHEDVGKDGGEGHDVGVGARLELELGGAFSVSCSRFAGVRGKDSSEFGESN